MSGVSDFSGSPWSGSAPAFTNASTTSVCPFSHANVSADSQLVDAVAVVVFVVEFVVVVVAVEVV